jgi:large subunit ribosomal protein L1
MAKKGKNYLKALEKIDKQKIYNIKEAISLIKDISYAKFDETIEVVIKLGIDPKHADQMVRGSVVLPHGLGKKVTVAVFAKGTKATEAKEAGADYVGDDDLVEKVEGGWTEFDKAVATPDMMRSVGKLGKILGPRGLMPTPKVGTVTNDVADVVKSLKSGMLEYRTDKAGLMHAPIGKKSFTVEQLVDNFNVLLDAVLKAKPSTSKGQYLLGIYISSTMSPGLQVERQRVA